MLDNSLYGAWSCLRNDLKEGRSLDHFQTFPPSPLRHIVYLTYAALAIDQLLRDTIVEKGQTDSSLLKPDSNR